MNQCDEQRFDLAGFSLAAKVWGPENGRPLLALHGMLDNAASFDLLAPHLNNYRIVALDLPGTGFSSHYPEGVLPYWKGDAFLLLQLIEQLGWKDFDIIAHSLGSLIGLTLAAIIPEKIHKLVLLYVLGPLMVFQDNAHEYLKKAADTFLHYQDHPPTIFANKEAAIQDRMTFGSVSYQAARVLVERGTKKTDAGYVWTFDRRVRCGYTTFPFDDSVRALLSMVKNPICLIRGDKGLRYPENIFDGRVASVSNLQIHYFNGGHHLHLDNSAPIAKIIREFL